ncbi:uncharacterized protein LOC131931510 [Physella acuta]|uniref:uncharacterized protein LOC131931510 n=1 Tax=Physella acuta TaxID=109671 RepID=UPI0027DACD9A|nr:uncharacterized protein LOC131931510 [Physella acuta]
MATANIGNKPQLPKALSLILVGNNEHEKCESGNSILCKNAFNMAPFPEDDTCKYKGYEIQVVDFPDVFNTKLKTEDGIKLFRTQMLNVLLAKPEGYNAFLIIVRFQMPFIKITDIDFIKRNLGRDVFKKYGIILMTNGYDFRWQTRFSLKTFCQQQTGDFKKLLEACNDRIVVFDNNNSEKDIEVRQREKLFKIVIDLDLKNEGITYKKNHFAKAQGIHTADKTTTAIQMHKAIHLTKKTETATPIEVEEKEAKRPKEIGLILIGNNGNGKSSTGNSIVNREVFKSSSNATSETRFPKNYICTFDGYRINVADCPGPLPTFIKPEDSTEMITAAIKIIMLSNLKGYNAFLYVVQYGARFSKEDINAVKIFKSVLGSNVFKDYGIIVMTYGDMFKQQQKGLTVTQFCEKQFGPFRDLWEECNKRIVLFDNMSKLETDRQNQRYYLIKTIDSLVCKQRYTDSYMVQLHTKHENDNEVQAKTTIDKLCSILVSMADLTNEKVKSFDMNAIAEELTELE